MVVGLLHIEVDLLGIGAHLFDIEVSSLNMDRPVVQLLDMDLDSTVDLVSLECCFLESKRSRNELYLCHLFA